MEGEPRLLYRLEESSDLSSWVGVSGGLSGTNGAARFVVPFFSLNETGPVFYRVGRQEVQPSDARAVWQSSGIADYRYRIEYRAGRAYVKAAVQAANGRVVSVEQVERLAGLTLNLKTAVEKGRSAVPATENS